MPKLTYLIIDLGALLTAVGLGLWRHQARLQQWRRTLGTLLLVGIPFIVWDISATWRGHWEFNPAYTLGLSVGGLPIEEWLFFIAIPLVAIAIWELMPAVADNVRWLQTAQWSVITACALLATTNTTHEYSLVVATVAAGAAALWLLSPQLARRWFLYQTIMMGLFLAANTVLTILPVVIYSAAHFSSIRIGSIPIEDFFYNFALVNLTVQAWLSLAPNRK